MVTYFQKLLPNNHPTHLALLHGFTCMGKWELPLHLVVNCSLHFCPGHGHNCTCCFNVFDTVHHPTLSRNGNFQLRKHIEDSNPIMNRLLLQVCRAAVDGVVLTVQS